MRAFWMSWVKSLSPSNPVYDYIYSVNSWHISDSSSVFYGNNHRNRLISDNDDRFLFWATFIMGSSKHVYCWLLVALISGFSSFFSYTTMRDEKNISLCLSIFLLPDSCFRRVFSFLGLHVSATWSLESHSEKSKLPASREAIFREIWIKDGRLVWLIINS